MPGIVYMQINILKRPYSYQLSLKTYCRQIYQTWIIANLEFHVTDL